MTRQRTPEGETVNVDATPPKNPAFSRWYRKNKALVQARRQRTMDPERKLQQRREWYIRHGRRRRLARWARGQLGPSAVVMFTLLHQGRRQRVPMIRVSSLAALLARSPDTINEWVGVHIPAARYRDGAGVRYYTIEQMDIFLASAQESGVRAAVRPSAAQCKYFARLVQARWERIAPEGICDWRRENERGGDYYGQGTTSATGSSTLKPGGRDKIPFHGPWRGNPDAAVGTRRRTRRRA